MGLQIYGTKNVDHVSKLIGVAFRLYQPKCGLLVQIFQSLHIHFWRRALFSFDFSLVILCATSTLGLMPPNTFWLKVENV